MPWDANGWPRLKFSHRALQVVAELAEAQKHLAEAQVTIILIIIGSLWFVKRILIKPLNVFSIKTELLYNNNLQKRRIPHEDS